MKVELNKKSNNPFYGMKNTLSLFNKTNGVVSSNDIGAAFIEAKTKEQKQLFYSILFSIGDITSRQHNIFGKTKADNGGNANRVAFDEVLEWIFSRDKKQFKKFLNAGLFNEYTCFDSLFKNRVQTKGTKVLKTYNLLADKEYREMLADYLYKVVNGNNPFNKMLVAKFLTLPRLSVRSGHKKMLPETKKVMKDKVALLIKLSKLCGWEYELNGNYTNFKGYREWRKLYNGELESVLFSSGKIKEFGKTEFQEWLNKLPASARFRVKNRVLYGKNEDESLKYPNLKLWFEEWEKFKDSKQEEKRILEEKVRQGTASNEDKERLVKVAKEAKVTVGATNFNEIYNDICTGSIDALKLESFMDRVNLPYNTLVFLDKSGSMRGAPYNFGSFIASVCLCKNPDDEGRNLLGFFDYNTTLAAYIDKQETAPNRLLRGTVKNTVNNPLVNPHSSFLDNYRTISAFCASKFGGGATYIDSIPRDLGALVKANPTLLDMLQNYPVWTIISDGCWNNLSSPEASMNAFFRECEIHLGYKPFIVAIDIKGQWGGLYNSPTRFSGIDNMIYIPSNPAQIEMFLTNFKDMDVFDVYTPLQSIFRSNRYEPVRNNVL